MCVAPITVVNPRYKGKSAFENRAVNELGKRGVFSYIDYTIKVPCGVCPECLSKYRNDMSKRIIYEMEKSYNPVFLTLTYSNDRLPAGGNLSKDDAKRFVKYLANHLPFEYTYYLCGEYGDMFERPHYHVCVMPKVEHDFFDWDTFLKSAWFPDCITDVLPLLPERCAYCCKYSCKQLGVNYSGRVKPFRLFSKSLGVGLIDEFGDLIKKSGVPELDGFALSRYYAQKLFSPSFLRIYYDRKARKYVDEVYKEHDNPERVRFMAATNKKVNAYEKEKRKTYR